MKKEESVVIFLALSSFFELYYIDSLYYIKYNIDKSIV